MDNESTLTKKILYETLISRVSQNTLGYKFAKSNSRNYYFTRESENKESLDKLLITIYLEKGKISARLLSIFDNSLKKENYVSDGLVNRNTFIANSKSVSPFGPMIWSYHFEKSFISLNETLDLFIRDLEEQGAIFIKSCEKRYSHPKFITCNEFIKSLNIDKNEILKLFKTQSYINKWGNWWSLKHPKFQELVTLLDKIEDEVEVKEGLRWSKQPNSYFAYEFFHKYCFE